MSPDGVLGRHRLLMLLAMLGLSSAAGSTTWQISLFAALLGAGFGLVNTPLATAVSRVVRPQLLASGLGVNSMLFFIGGSLGAAALIGFSVAGGASSLNPLHEDLASGFSNGFLFLAVPVVLLLVLSAWLPLAARGAGPDELATGAGAEPAWRPDCSVPWAPEVDLAPAEMEV